MTNISYSPDGHHARAWRGPVLLGYSFLLPIPHPDLSTVSYSSPPFPDAAVLLVLLPPEPSATAQAATRATLLTLQQQLGAAIRVLRVDEASHPDVVRSFDGRDLPAWVLMRHGVELGRQPGLPAGAATVALLLSKLEPLLQPPVGLG